MAAKEIKVRLSKLTIVSAKISVLELVRVALIEAGAPRDLSIEALRESGIKRDEKSEHYTYTWRP